MKAKHCWSNQTKVFEPKLLFGLTSNVLPLHFVFSSSQNSNVENFLLDLHNPFKSFPTSLGLSRNIYLKETLMSFNWPVFYFSTNSRFLFSNLLWSSLPNFLTFFYGIFFSFKKCVTMTQNFNESFFIKRDYLLWAPDGCLQPIKTNLLSLLI